MSVKDVGLESNLNPQSGQVETPTHWARLRAAGRELPRCRRWAGRAGGCGVSPRSDGAAGPATEKLTPPRREPCSLSRVRTVGCLWDLKLRGVCCAHGCTPLPTPLLPTETRFSGEQMPSLGSGWIRNVPEAGGPPWIRFSLSSAGRKELSVTH